MSQRPIEHFNFIEQFHFLPFRGNELLTFSTQVLLCTQRKLSQPVLSAGSKNMHLMGTSKQYAILFIRSYKKKKYFLEAVAISKLQKLHCLA